MFRSSRTPKPRRPRNRAATQDADQLSAIFGPILNQASGGMGTIGAEIITYTIWGVKGFKTLF